jgi:hypothetical protein
VQFERMQEIEEELFEKIRDIRRTKGREYATDEDTLADFKEVAEESGITPLQCWATYVKKHERAIDAYVREGSVKSEAIEGRILDVIVYHLLLLGLIEDLRPTGPIGVAMHAAEAGEPVAVSMRSSGLGGCPMTYNPPDYPSPVGCALPFGHEGPHVSMGGTRWETA